MIRRLTFPLLRKKQPAGKMIFHIGPPKTATTAIQSALQKLNGKNLQYLGTNQPRSKIDRNGIYFQLMRCISSDCKSRSIAKVRRRINSTLNRGVDLVISEEMFLVSGTGERLERKLERLTEIVDCEKCEIVITLRDPISALKSMYSELYFRQKVVPLLSFEEFLETEQALAFDYPYLIDKIYKMGFDTVRCLSFEGGLSRINLGDITGRAEHDQLIQLHLLNRSEANVVEKTRSLAVPDELETRLRLGYIQTLAKYNLH